MLFESQDDEQVRLGHTLALPGSKKVTGVRS